MATIVTRQVGATAKNALLTNAEMDQNFINLNDAVVQIEQSLPQQIADIAFMAAIIYG